MLTSPALGMRLHRARFGTDRIEAVVIFPAIGQAFDSYSQTGRDINFRQVNSY